MSDGLSCQDLSVRRGTSVIVQGASFAVQPGTVTALIGPNGAGKSTLLRALAGLLPYSGSVVVAGGELRGMAIDERARTLAYVPQHSLLSADMRVCEVVAQGRFAHARGFGRRVDAHDPRVLQAMADAHVSALRDRSYAKLSGGEQRRVLLARALATEARVLLLDEPTAGLDVAHVLRFHQRVRELAAHGFCVVSVLHDLFDVADHADRAILLSRGLVVADGRPQDVVRSPEAERVYGVRVALAEQPRFALTDAS